MTDTALENALAKRDELAAGIAVGKAEIEKIRVAMAEDEGALVKINSFIALWYEMAGVEPPGSEPKTDLLGPVPTPAPKSEKPKNPDRKYVSSVAADLAWDAGRPLSRAEVAAGLRECGVVLVGKDPMMVLSTMLWRTPETIARIDGFGYWPADKPYPPGNYTPPEE